MAEVETSWQLVYMGMLDDIEKRIDYLTDWEDMFIESLRNHLKNPKFVISHKQTQRLEFIWERLCKAQPSTVVSADGDR